MNRSLLQTGVLLLWMAGIVSAGPAASTARLIAEVDSIRAGAPFALGVLVDLPDGWHTYWMNPGDAGMAPRVEWRLPEGFTAGPLQWPFPESIEEPPLLSFGYTDQMTLFSVITPPNSLAAGQPCLFKAALSWLICKDSCVPQTTNLTCTLPVRPDPPAWSADWHPLFERTRRQLPLPDAGWSFQAAVTPTGVTLRVTPPPGVTSERIRQSRFYPCEPGVVDVSQAAWHRTDHTDSLPLKRYAGPMAFPDRLKGVLVLPPESPGSLKRAISVDTPVAREHDLARPDGRNKETEP